MRTRAARPRGRGGWLGVVALIAAIGVIAVACGGGDGEQAEAGAELKGTVQIAGSSTVFPIAEAWAEEFGLENRGVRVNVASIGSGAGFERFCSGETDISNASRPMTASEAAICAENGIAFIEIPVAFDGLTVAVNIENDWVDFLTVTELQTIFGVSGFATRWAEVREGFPDEPILLFSPGADSGTFDYFSETINGEAGVQRTNRTQFSEDDNVLVRGVAGERRAIGYFGFAFFVNSRDAIRAVPIDGGAGPVGPTVETIGDGSYAPLSRPLLIYIRVESLREPAVRTFVEWALTVGRSLIDDPTVGYVQLPDSLYAVSLARVAAGEATGALVQAAPDGATLAEIFAN